MVRIGGEELGLSITNYASWLPYAVERVLKSYTTYCDTLAIREVSADPSVTRHVRSHRDSTRTVLASILHVEHIHSRLVPLSSERIQITTVLDFV